jgi:hypothetical protein
MILETQTEQLNIPVISNNTYFICSKKVVDFAKPTEISKPFKSGYQHDLNNEYFIAVVDFDKIEEHYNQLSDDEQDDFWLQELITGTMDVSEITLKGLKENGIFFEIERIIGLTTTKNRAMTINNLSEKFNCNPIEFINKILK